MTKSFELPTRDMTIIDRRFVVATWARSARYGLRVPERFRLVDSILDGGARVLVMATDDRTDHAWLAYDEDVLHYVYVAPELRRMNIARALIALAFGESGPAFTTHDAPSWWSGHRLTPRARLNPYLLAMPKAA